VLDAFYVVTAVFNPCRYRSRLDLYQQFKKYMADSGVKLFTVELAHGDRPFEVTTPDNPLHLQLRTQDEIWHKERLLNLGIQKLPAGWVYVAWVDADVRFAKPNWADETVQLLQHYPVLQLFSQATDLTPENEILKVHRGYVWAYHQNRFVPGGRNYEHFHPGFAWAARRDALDDLGGLFDTAVLGAGDRHMAMALTGDVSASHPKGISPGYISQLQRWEKRATSYIRGNVGYLPGTLLHYWHGKKADRGYGDRWKILIRHHYDPEVDLKTDTQGCYRLTDRNPSLRYDIRRYFASRNEDSIECPRIP